MPRVMPFPTPSRPPFMAVTEKHRREVDEAYRLAPQVHESDIRMGRCESEPWDAIGDERQADCVRRASMLVRLGDATVVRTITTHAANALIAEHELPVHHMESALVTATTILRVALQHLEGHVGAVRL